MTDPWVPTPIIGPDLIRDIAPELFQYAVTLQRPTVGPPTPLGEEQLVWNTEIEHMPAMIGITMGAVLHERITPEMTLESKTANITFGDYLPQVDTSWRVIDEANGDVYELVSIVHPVNAMTQATATKIGS